MQNLQLTPLKILLFNALFIFLVVFYGCKKGDQSLPLIVTQTISNWSEFGATCGGIVYYEGKGEIIQKGVCWNTSGNPVIEDEKTEEGGGNGNFSSKITGLKSSTRYFVRAYATNKHGTSYGEIKSFVTNNPAPLPAMVTTPVFSVGVNSAVAGGSFAPVSGNAPIIESGVCFGTNTAPTIADKKQPFASVSLINTVSINGLANNTTYYLRAYATNSTDTAYGNEVTFKTYQGTVTDADGNVYFTIKIGNQEWTLENYKGSRLFNGVELQKNVDYSYYDDNLANQETYGNLYHWDVIVAPSFAPPGWRVPTKQDFVTLINFLGAPDQVGVGVALKANGGAWRNGVITTNSSGFTALPGGRVINNSFNFMTFGAYFWSTTLSSTNPPTAHTLDIISSGAFITSYQIQNSMFSVRLIKN